MRKTKIFVSYAHADMEPWPGYTVSRASRLLDQIRHELGCHSTNAQFELLRDVEGVVNVMDHLDEMIEEVIDNCELGLVLLSPSYVVSQECIRELHLLLRAEKRVCIVELSDAWTELYEDHLQEQFEWVDRIVRAPFWGVKNNVKARYGWPLPELDKKHGDDFFASLTVVSEAIKTWHRELPRGDEIEEEDALRDLPQQAVFIAAPTADVRKETKLLENALKAEGFAVFQFDPYLHLSDGCDAREMIKLALDKCHVAIQLLGGVPGRPLQNGEARSVQLQFDVVKESDKPFHCWELSDLDRSEYDPDHQSFLERAQAHKSSYEEFEQYVVKQVRDHLDGLKISGPHLGEPGEARTPIPIVGIDFAEQDEKLAGAVMDELEKKDVNILPLEFDLDAKQFESAVGDSDGIVMVFGTSRAGRNRTRAHFSIAQRYNNKNLKAPVDLAIGRGVVKRGEQEHQNPNGDEHGDDGDGDGPKDGGAATAGADLHPRGPNVHVIFVDTKRLVVDETTLEAFIEDVKENAGQRYGEPGG